MMPEYDPRYRGMGFARRGDDGVDVAPLISIARERQHHLAGLH
jgi:hypothetical protein